MCGEIARFSRLTQLPSVAGVFGGSFWWTIGQGFLAVRLSSLRSLRFLAGAGDFWHMGVFGTCL